MSKVHRFSCTIALAVLSGGCSLEASEATPTTSSKVRPPSWIPRDIAERLNSRSGADEILRKKLTTPDVPDFTAAASLGRAGLHEVVVGIGPDRFCVGLFNTAAQVVSLNCTASAEPRPLWVSVVDKKTGQEVAVSILPYEIDETTLSPTAHVVSGHPSVAVFDQGFPEGGTEIATRNSEGQITRFDVGK